MQGSREADVEPQKGTGACGRRSITSALGGSKLWEHRGPAQGKTHSQGTKRDAKRLDIHLLTLREGLNDTIISTFQGSWCAFGKSKFFRECLESQWLSVTECQEQITIRAGKQGAVGVIIWACRLWNHNYQPSGTMLSSFRRIHSSHLKRLALLPSFQLQTGGHQDFQAKELVQAPVSWPGRKRGGRGTQICQLSQDAFHTSIAMTHFTEGTDGDGLSVHHIVPVGVMEHTDSG